MKHQSPSKGPVSPTELVSVRRKWDSWELAEVYVGPGVKFPPFDDPPAGHVIHITAERIGGVGPWAD